MTPVIRRSVIALAATTCAVMTAGGAAAVAVGTPHVATVKQTIASGKTTVDINAKTAKVLRADGFAVTTTGKASLKGATLSLPVTGGTYNQGVGTVKHAGGIKITRGSTTVTISSLVVHPSAGTATADVAGHGRIQAVLVGAPQSGNGGPHFVQYGGFTVKLSKPAIKILDAKFSTMAFANHPTLGIGSTTLHFTK